MSENFYEKHYGETTLNPRTKRIFDVVLNLEPKSILDIGCGNGFLISELTKHGILCQGTDVSAEAVKLCNEKGVKATQTDVDNSNLPFNSENFDVVICSEVIEHLFDPDHVLEEIRRVLAQKGFLVLTTPNLGWWLNRIVLLLGYQPYNTEVSSRRNLGRLHSVCEGVSGHIRMFTFRSLKELVNLYGFNIVDCFGTHELLISNKVLGLVDQLIGRKVSLACNIGLLCQKQD
jgi:methionine biosynthesis protein MetW